MDRTDSGGGGPTGEAPARKRERWLRARDWVLLDLDRYVLAAGLLLVGFVTFLWLGVAGPVDLGRDPVPALYLFSALVGGNVTLITIVVTINQLILSRELRSPRELRTEMEATEDYREAVQTESDRLVVPERPREFLRLLISDAQGRLAELEEASDEEEAAFQRELADLSADLQAEFEETVEELEGSRGGVFPALSTILDADLAARINRLRWLSSAYDASVSDSLVGRVEDLEDCLEQLDVARQYFKTIYIKQELADVSKLVMATGLVAIVVGTSAIVFAGYVAGPSTFPGTVLLLALAATVSLVPLVLLISHVTRIATIAQRTAAITPFLAPTG